MLDLSQTTFIIPIGIDSPDREFNFLHTVQYLCDNLKTKIFIWESGKEQHVHGLLKKINDRLCEITYQFNQTSEVFHRTKMLNEMLFHVKTPVVANYDIDILLPCKVYFQAQQLIVDGVADLVYPYFKGMSQYRVWDKKQLQAELVLVPGELWQSMCGHCQFFNTTAYRAGGMENENFISWGPEDSERMERFTKFGFKVMWLTNFIWHLEHWRGDNSGEKNKYFYPNLELYRKLSAMDALELKEYYLTQEYVKKYQG